MSTEQQPQSRFSRIHNPHMEAEHFTLRVVAAVPPVHLLAAEVVTALVWLLVAILTAVLGWPLQGVVISGIALLLAFLLPLPTVLMAQEHARLRERRRDVLQAREFHALYDVATDVAELVSLLRTAPTSEQYLAKMLDLTTRAEAAERESAHLLKAATSPEHPIATTSTAPKPKPQPIPNDGDENDPFATKVDLRRVTKE